MQRWRSLQGLDRRLDNPFLSPEFTRVVGDVDERVRVAVLEEGTQVVGFFPFTRIRRGVARSVAAGVASCSGFLTAPEPPVDLASLLRQCGLHTWEFADLAASDTLAQHTNAHAELAHVADVSGGYEHYLQAVQPGHKRFFSNLRRKRRRLEAEQGEVTFTCEETDATVLRQLLVWKSAQYRASGWPDPLAKRWVVEVISRLAETTTPALRGHLGALRAGGRLLAADFSVRSDTVFAGWLTSYNKEFARYSPGMIQFLHVVEDAARHGASSVDMGVGDQAYKATLATGTAPLYRGYADRATARALARRAARYPRAHAERFVLAHPGLRSRVRTTLGMVGKLRTTGSSSSAALFSEILAGS